MSKVSFPFRSIFGALLLAALPATASAFPMSEWTVLAHTTYIQQGHGGPVIYDIFDPNCPYCHVLFKDWQPFIHQGQITVRYVPVGYLTPTSAPEAAAILQAADPLSALKRLEAAAGSGTGAASARATPATAQKLRENLHVLQATRAPGIPIAFYRQDGQVNAIMGAPPPRVLARVVASLGHGSEIP